MRYHWTYMLHLTKFTSVAVITDCYQYNEDGDDTGDPDSTHAVGMEDILEEDADAIDSGHRTEVLRSDMSRSL